jgi:hypothetical protein
MNIYHQILVRTVVKVGDSVRYPVNEIMDKHIKYYSVDRDGVALAQIGNRMFSILGSVKAQLIPFIDNYEY